ncbi:MAG: hypothetical protein DRJ64_08340 [Thermoprotei archaeon]|nr:MAG: hypothetical protein DRJ64_08340 [Thermoprotei archaeon]
MPPLTEILQTFIGFLFLIGIFLALFGKRLYDLGNFLIGGFSGFIFGYLIYAVSGGSTWGILAILFFTIIGAFSAYAEPYAIVGFIAFLVSFALGISIIMIYFGIGGWLGLLLCFIIAFIFASIIVAIFQEYLIFATSLLGGICVGYSYFIDAVFVSNCDPEVAFIHFIVITIAVCITGDILQHIGISPLFNIIGSLLQKIPVFKKISLYLETRLQIHLTEKTNLLGIIGGIITLIFGVLNAIGGVFYAIGGGHQLFVSLGIIGTIWGIIGIIFGIEMVKSVVMMNKVESIRRGVNLMLIFSILGLITMQGWIIGPILGLVSGILNRKGAKEPKNSADWAFKSGFFALKNRLEEALKCAEESLKTDPQNSDAWAQKGAILRDMGKYEDAIYCCNKALEIDSSYEEAEDFKKSAEKSLKTDPQVCVLPYPQKWVLKGTILYGMGEYEDAIYCCNKALEIDSSYEEAEDFKKICIWKRDG